MKEFTSYEEVYGKRTLTNGNTEWFGTVTGKHIYSPKEVDFNTPKTDKNYLLKSKGKHCDKCGQKLDWSEV